MTTVSSISSYPKKKDRILASQDNDLGKFTIIKAEDGTLFHSCLVTIIIFFMFSFLGFPMRAPFKYVCIICSVKKSTHVSFQQRTPFYASTSVRTFSLFFLTRQPPSCGRHEWMTPSAISKLTA